MGTHLAARVPSLSRRGENLETLYIIKSNVISPGVNILTGWTGVVGRGPPGPENDMRQTQFSISSGTSMVCPNVSGVVALLKGAYPNSSPAEISSALMTTQYA